MDLIDFCARVIPPSTPQRGHDQRLRTIALHCLSMFYLGSDSEQQQANKDSSKNLSNHKEVEKAVFIPQSTK